MAARKRLATKESGALGIIGVVDEHEPGVRGYETRHGHRSRDVEQNRTVRARRRAVSAREPDFREAVRSRVDDRRRAARTEHLVVYDAIGGGSVRHVIGYVEGARGGATVGRRRWMRSMRRSWTKCFTTLEGLGLGKVMTAAMHAIV